MRSAQHWHVVSTQRSAGWGKGRESLRGPSTGQLPTACSYLLPRFCRLPPPASALPPPRGSQAKAAPNPLQESEHQGPGGLCVHS